MTVNLRGVVVAGVVCLAGWVGLGVAAAAGPSVDAALKLRPVQSGVDYDVPAADQVARCSIGAEKQGSRVGWVVRDPSGLLLRRFVDTNGDNVVDQWCYFKDGLEVYRDIDADFNGKVDQYRWFHTAGSRWGIDLNQDGRIDQWKSISPEELSAELVAALAHRNPDRFAALVLAPEELKLLGLGEAMEAKIAKRLGSLAADFQTLAARQQAVGPDARWIQFSGSHPGVVPAGTDGSTKDVKVYENVLAIAESGGKHAQIQVGTLVQTGDAWRLVDLPQLADAAQAEAAPVGLFFQASVAGRVEPGGESSGEAAQQLLAELEKLDASAAAATTPAAQADYNARRADLVERIAGQAGNPKDRQMWLRQLADMISAAVQSGTYPDGARRLEALFEKLDKNPADKDLAAYVRFRELTAEYVLAIQAPKADFAKIQTEYLGNLKTYVADYPTAPDAAEAILQLAIAEEFAGQEDEAKAWYARVVKDFPSSPAAEKAAGAQRRLDSEGKTITLSGKSPSGSQVSLADLRGKVVLIQYWATWCEPAKNDMALLKRLVEKYPKSFTVLGVSLDVDRKAMSDFLASARLPWPQIFEEGGLDSPPANQLGILTLPTMILVDDQGRVVNRNVQAAELEKELERLLSR